jgi:hypothetical protein
LRRKRYGGWNLYPTAVALVRPGIGDLKDDDVPEQYRQVAEGDLEDAPTEDNIDLWE